MIVVLVVVAAVWVLVLAGVVGICRSARAGDVAMLAAEAEVPFEVRVAEAAAEGAPGRSVALMN